MSIMIFFLVIAFVLYMNASSNLETKDIYEFSVIILAVLSIGGLIIIYGFDEFKPSIVYLVPIPILFFLNKAIKKALAPPQLEIIANQQRYYEDALAKKIVKFYENRKIIKRNRVDVAVNDNAKKLVVGGVIRPQFFVNYFDFKGTKIKDLKELENNAVFKIIFSKVKEFIYELEVEIDYKKELEKNDFITEFFLMDLWERYTPKFNISVANLDIFAKSKNDNEFLGAIDLLNLNCVKFKGAGIFYAYLEFKDRLKDFIPELANGEENNQNLIPQETEFDEKYAKENDSDKTPYVSDNEKDIV